MNLEETLKALVEEALAATDLFLVELKGNSTQTKFQIAIDGDNGVSIGQCSQVSRYVSRKLDEMELPEKAFTYEVSSPGADLPLKMLRQYNKHIGRTLEVTLNDGTKQTGVLEAVSNNEIVLAPEPVKGHQKKNAIPQTPWSVLVDDIKETRVVLKFK